MKTLILTEKPSVAQDFARALGINVRKDGYLENNEYIITWGVGHLVELLEPDEYDAKWKKWNLDTLPIIPDSFKYKPISKTEKQLKIIKKLLKNPLDMVVIATDAGREGEVIARTILLFSGFKDSKKINRFWTSQALTPEVVRDGMNSLKKASKYDRLWKAGQSRQIADWLVGMNCSRAATIKMNDLFSVGRVQTAVLSLLVDRRRERENFKPEPYWLVRANFSNDKGNWWGLWFKGEITRFSKEKDAKEVLAKIDSQTGKVKSVKKQKKKQPPPLLFSLTDLQRDANSKFGLSATVTLNIAQRLYEDKKCLSYPRTDSKVLGTKNVSMTQSIVKELSLSYPNIFAGVEPKLISASNKRVFNDSKLTDHHALIPLKPVPEGASGDEKKIYDLVLKRFSAAFHPDCEYEQTEIVTEVQKEKFRTRGRRILKPGWQLVYDAEDDKKKPGDDEEEPENLPLVAKDDPAKVEQCKTDKKQTTPPQEYTEALLLKDMTNPARYVSEDELKKVYRGDVGLGTQATRAQTIETLLSRKYVERKKRNLIATDKGCHLIETLRQFKFAKNIASPEETARWEQRLNLISQGKGSDEEFLGEIKSFVAQAVDEFKNTEIRIMRTQTFGQCPVCGGKIIEGKRGFGCSNWKKQDGECRFVIWKNISGRMITPPVISKLLDKKEAGPFGGFVSEDNQRFSGMLRLVKEKKEWQVRLEPVDNLPEKKSDPGVMGECPACGGNVIEGTKGYGCANWRDKDGGCKFVIWKIIAQKEISKETAVKLLETGITEKIDGFKSRKGNTFATKLKLESDGTGLFKVSFDFSDN
ncbi:MAG: DNA topoisomerase III [Desulfobacterales bacterium]|nr:DNA topoisomerase III [Desulfobacterales bacterium]